MLFRSLFTDGAPRSSQELVQKCPCIPESNWNLKMLVFEERGKPEYSEKNLSEQSTERTDNKLNPHMTPGPGIEPGPHWWEAGALTTAPYLFPNPEL